MKVMDNKPSIRSHIHDKETTIIDAEIFDDAQDRGDVMFSSSTTNSMYEFDDEKPHFYHLFGQTVNGQTEDGETVQVFITGIMHTQEPVENIEMPPEMQYLETFDHPPTDEDINNHMPEEQ